MKRIISTIICISAAIIVCFSQNVPYERIYLSTDRSFYAAGETVYCSAFCLNENNGFSSFSSVAYVELYSSKGMAASAKIALQDGRGAGSIAIPSDLPTGNYRLSAYTAVAKNIPGFDFADGGCIVSVYNTTSVKKADEVLFTDDIVPAAAKEFGGLSIYGKDGIYSIMSPYSDAYVSVSVFKDEGLVNYNGSSIYSFLNSTPSYSSYTGFAIPEYDGEIIRATVSGEDGKPLSSLSNTDIYIGCPGNNEDLYAARLKEDGKATFYTSNIYGDKDMAVMLLEKAGQWDVSFASPFVGLSSADIPALQLSVKSKGAIERLGVASQVSKAFERDTIFTKMPVRRLPFLGSSHASYRLDDYTRLRSMREVFTEILKDVNMRSFGEVKRVFIRCEDNFNQIPSYRSTPSLVIIDGVPLLDHELLMDYDPLLFESIDVYPYEYSFGNTNYAGVLSLNTYKKDISGLNLGKETKIVSFKGVSYPLAFSNAGFPGNYPSLRQTLYWMPLAYLEAGKAFCPDFIVPERPGCYIIKVEGLTADYKPLYKEFKITVE
ncbi:MAG: hypothetical protein IJ151_03395 [Bacteroidales bacterium]|nr:hypothetical protein [Bacteroidales bacterium]